MDKKKILVIEDEPDQVALTRMRLEAVGFEVIAALGGEEGIKKAAAEKPDLILLDIIMPRVDGYQVCRNLKNNPQTSAIPVIVVTAAVVREVDKKANDFCVDYWLKKPYESSVLVAQIKTILGD